MGRCLHAERIPLAHVSVNVVGLQFVETVGDLLKSSMDVYTQLLPVETVKTLQRLCLLGLVSLFEGRRDWMVHDRLLVLLKVDILKDLMTRVRQDLHTFHGDRCVRGCHVVSIRRRLVVQHGGTPVVDVVGAVP